jgi:pimeloyl-ACP methyl ester carboxylesterase
LPEWEVTGTLRGYDPSPELATLAIPTLVVTGRYDRVTPPTIAYKLRSACPPDCVQLVVFERSAHRPWVEEADKYFQVVGEFLD